MNALKKEKVALCQCIKMIDFLLYMENAVPLLKACIQRIIIKQSCDSSDKHSVISVETNTADNLIRKTTLGHDFFWT